MNPSLSCRPNQWVERRGAFLPLFIFLEISKPTCHPERRAEPRLHGKAKSRDLVFAVGGTGEACRKPSGNYGPPRPRNRAQDILQPRSNKKCDVANALAQAPVPPSHLPWDLKRQSSHCFSNCAAPPALDPWPSNILS